MIDAINDKRITCFNDEFLVFYNKTSILSCQNSVNKNTIKNVDSRKLLLSDLDAETFKKSICNSYKSFEKKIISKEFSGYVTPKRDYSKLFESLNGVITRTNYDDILKQTFNFKDSHDYGNISFVSNSSGYFAYLRKFGYKITNLRRYEFVYTPDLIFMELDKNF